MQPRTSNTQPSTGNTQPLTPPTLPVQSNPYNQHNPPKLEVSWKSIGILLLVFWLLFLGGLERIANIGTTIERGATRTAATAGAVGAAGATGTPSANKPTATVRIVIATPRPGVVVVPGTGSGTGNGDPAPETTPTAVPSATPVPVPADCVLITWQDGSQGCTDGRVISAERSRPGYCTPVQNYDGTNTCTNGELAGIVNWVDPEIAAEPTNTPWPAKVSDETLRTGTFFTTWYEPDGTSCVAVAFADGHKQQNCGPKGVKYNAGTLEFIARLIIDGKLGPGGFPKG